MRSPKFQKVIYKKLSSSSSRYGHTIKSTPHPIPNCEVKLDGPVQYWGGGPLGKFSVLYRTFFFACCSACSRLLDQTSREIRLAWLVLKKIEFIVEEEKERATASWFYSSAEELAPAACGHSFVMFWTSQQLRLQNRDLQFISLRSLFPSSQIYFVY